MFDTTLVITLFSLASLFVCLLTLRLSIYIKHLSLFSFDFKIPTNTISRTQFLAAVVISSAIMLDTKHLFATYCNVY